MRTLGALLVLPWRLPGPMQHQGRRPPSVQMQQLPSSALEPDAVVEALLGALQAGSAGLPTAHELMSPAYHERTDAFERFCAWFSSPAYESLLGCREWEMRGSVSTCEAMREIPLQDGRTFHGSASVQMLVRADITAGRAKWADSGARGSRVGQPLPTTTYLFTLSLQTEGPLAECWTVDQIVPEAPIVAPVSVDATTPAPNAAGEGQIGFDSSAPSSAFWESLVALVATAVVLTAGRWLGEHTGVFGASLDPAYWDEAPSRVTLYNLLD